MFWRVGKGMLVYLGEDRWVYMKEYYKFERLGIMYRDVI